ncbi:hypothetical protein ACFFIS_07765 [Virgibacillus soli]|uniref:Lipoprotein n=1 Tax=Paracerasibacillus soli TaxID=480284 RepID=A0ABU5CQV2_9BACI|nr:hypothetical protein [Virgibacillus soli]MDY0407845.1 hypothetical protein [Virgibacillus soli]
MKKLMVFISLILMLVGCNQDDMQDRTGLEKSVQSIMMDEDISEIHIKSLTDFDWEKAYLITPYSDQKSIEKQIGVSFKDKSNMNMRDDIYLIVFIQDDKVIQYAELKRQGADFSVGEKEYLTPIDDVIKIDRYKE